MPESINFRRRYRYKSSAKKFCRHVFGVILINKDWILTAAHCLEGSNETTQSRYLKAYLSTNHKYKNGSNYNIWKILINNCYIRERIGVYDIALLKVNYLKLIEFGTIGAVNSFCLLSKDQNLLVSRLSGFSYINSYNKSSKSTDIKIQAVMELYPFGKFRDKFHLRIICVKQPE